MQKIKQIAADHAMPALWVLVFLFFAWQAVMQSLRGNPYFPLLLIMAFAALYRSVAPDNKPGAVSRLHSAPADSPAGGDCNNTGCRRVRPPSDIAGAPAFDFDSTEPFGLFRAVTLCACLWLLVGLGWWLL